MYFIMWILYDFLHVICDELALSRYGGTNILINILIYEIIVTKYLMYSYCTRNVPVGLFWYENIIMYAIIILTRIF